MTQTAALPYRPCVGLMIVNAEGRVLVASRIDTPGAWQMPQGGIDPGESPRAAAFREMREEVGSDRALILAEHPDWLRYDLPSHLVGKVWGGRWRGQEQKWFLLRFTGRDEEIDIAREEPEFSAWRWAGVDELVGLIVPFKRDIYARVVEAFRPLVTGERRPGIGARALHHVQITVPADREEAALAFYREVLALPERAQPDEQARRGGAWFVLGDAEIHLKPEATAPEAVGASKRHVCLTVPDLAAAEAALRAAGAPVLPDERPIPDVRRLFTRDPGGNRLEIAQA